MHLPEENQKVYVQNITQRYVVHIACSESKGLRVCAAPKHKTKKSMNSQSLFSLSSLCLSLSLSLCLSVSVSLST